jgi:hypothetical protein
VLANQASLFSGNPSAQLNFSTTLNSTFKAINHMSGSEYSNVNFSVTDWNTFSVGLFNGASPYTSYAVSSLPNGFYNASIGEHESY